RQSDGPLEQESKPGAPSNPAAQSGPGARTQPSVQPPAPQPQPELRPPEGQPSKPKPEALAAQSELEIQPLNDVRFGVKLRSKISSETSEEGRIITASVVAPESCSGCTMIGVVNKAGKSGFI